MSTKNERDLEIARPIVFVIDDDASVRDDLVRMAETRIILTAS
jgi:FixJ family two-component response regulator